MAGLVRITAVVASVLVGLGFLLFAMDEADRGSAQQQTKLANDLEPAPSRRGEAVREKRQSRPRELIDDANDVLLAPFAGLTSGKDLWTQHLVSGALALLAYGLGLMLLANYLPQPRRTSTSWDAAPDA